ncbi:hypothetical protein RKD49_005418 [Streptomyces glaucescens]
MITFVDLGPKATVHLFLKVPVVMSGLNWTWGELPKYAGLLAREYAYSAHECASVVHTYGRTMGRLLQRQGPDRFMITARGPVTGNVLGIREWQWAAEPQEFRPVGEYLCGWRSAVKAYFELTGELFSHCRFDAREGGLPVVTRSKSAPLANAA